YHFIRWVIEEGQMRLVYCPTEDMLADALTKALPSPKVKHFAAELGLRREASGGVLDVRQARAGARSYEARSADSFFRRIHMMLRPCLFSIALRIFRARDAHTYRDRLDKSVPQTCPCARAQYVLCLTT
ncbi:hypothetical protein K488DRAFT_66233, partial [Vararia minispora EC-137]